MKEKLCPRCEQVKSWDEYYIDKRSGKPRTYCKSCQGLYSKEWKQENPDKVRQRNRVHQLAHKLKNVYKITQEEYDALEKVCQICGGVDKLFIDHDHSTGKVRGMLCNGCNSGIGFFKEDVALLSKAIKYLKQHG